jgi:hypothetical protein
MRRLRPGSEAEMIALFLSAELGSDLYGPGILALLERDGVPPTVITTPDLADAAENRARLRLLTAHRGYGNRTEIFEDFPDDVRWEWMALTPAELATVRYIDYSYWIELSGGTRLAVDAVPRIRAGVAPFGVPNDGLLSLARAIAAGVRFPPLILVTTEPGGPLMVLEGHGRLTGYMLAYEHLPPELEMMVGTSPLMTGWDCW